MTPGPGCNKEFTIPNCDSAGQVVHPRYPRRANQHAADLGARSKVRTAPGPFSTTPWIWIASPLRRALRKLVGGRDDWTAVDVFVVIGYLTMMIFLIRE